MSLLLFTSFSTQMSTMTVDNPSLTTYQNLQISYPNSLRCPCSMTKISYERFVSLSPTYHQVCSSDFVREEWIPLLMVTHITLNLDWASRSVHQFRLLSTICQLVNSTISDAVEELIVQSIVTSNVLTEDDFNAQLNTTIKQYLQSIVINFGLLVDTVQLFTHVDQPYQISEYHSMLSYITTDQIYNSESWKVGFHLFNR